MKVAGACHCGAIAFEAEIHPDNVSICHCTDCQTLSGAPYRASVAVRSENLKFTRGAPKIYVKTAQSGNKRAQGFCADCGTPIYSTSTDDNPAMYMVRAGSIAQRDQLIPKLQMWHRSAQPWTAHVADIAIHPGGMPPPIKS